ncbi:MAG: hypothetical protein QOI40_2800, partial [Alphaproteobacteria bacterium]|nr:hypothetical protein [Alphaproteobacteria bacterium]
MSRHLLPVVVIAALGTVPAAAQVLAPQVSAPQIYSQQVEAVPQAPVRYAAAPRAEMGGGFVEFLFGGGEP